MTNTKTSALDPAEALLKAQKNAADRAVMDAFRRAVGEDGRYLQHGRMTKRLRAALKAWNASPAALRE